VVEKGGFGRPFSFGLREGAADAAPILDRMLLTGHDLDRDLVVTRVRQRADALL